MRRSRSVAHERRAWSAMVTLALTCATPAGSWAQAQQTELGARGQPAAAAPPATETAPAQSTAPALEQTVAPAPVAPAPVPMPAATPAPTPRPQDSAEHLANEETVRGEVGLHGEIDVSGSGDKAIGPTVRFYFDDVSLRGRPAPEAAFLAHAGSAEATFTASAAKGQTVSSSTGEDTNGGLGFDVALRWVGKRTPFTLRVPFSTQAYYWPDSGDDAVMNSYGAGVEPGYYVRPDTELSVGFQMGWANLFTSGSSSSAYSYTGWDLKMLWVRGRSVLDLGGGRWLAVHATFSRLGDQQDNKLYAVAFDGRYYPATWIGLGPRVSYSTYSGPNNPWAVGVKMMGVRSVGATVALDLDGGRWGIIGGVDHQVPEGDSASSRTMTSFEAVARFQ